MKRKYNNLNQIGKGTYAKVYRATSPTSDLPIVIKKFTKKKDEENIGIAPSTIVEISLLIKLQHPNIIRMLEYDTEFKYIILQSYSYDLNKYIDKFYPLNNIIDITKQILDGINYLHTNKFMHLDLKPDNLKLGN